MSEYRTPLGMGPRVTPTTVAVRDLRPGDVIQDDTRRRTVKYLVHVLAGVWVAFEDGGDLIDRPPLEEVTRLIAADVARPCPAEQLDNDGGDDPDQLAEALAERQATR